MDARDIMTRPVMTVHPDTLIRDAIAALVEHGFAALPVVDSEDRVLGIFSEADALRSAAGLSAEAAVGSMMTTPVEVVDADTDVARIAEHMLRDRRRCVPVVYDGVLIGVISRRDLLRSLVRQDDTIAAALRAVLAEYAGPRRRWSVNVVGGVAAIRGEFTDAAERQTIEALARTVPGVSSAEVSSVKAEV
ncbi:CBS domain-containing protein [Saccharomonospora sp. NPDC046836]|uniref:CBS domain-containing protein n=1 Tax=Saccharomonospora sp. NPDC046836 TaxID=3156921 RepID=UPI0033ECA57E